MHKGSIFGQQQQKRKRISVLAIILKAKKGVVAH